MSRSIVDFGPDQKAAIKRFAEQFHRTESDIVRAGVALFQIATREASRGHALGIVNSGRVVSELTGVWTEATQVDDSQVAI